MQKPVEKKDYFMTYESLHQKKRKPETANVTAHPSSLQFLFRGNLTKFSSKIAVLKIL